MTACGEDVLSPNLIAGTYSATEFTVVQGGPPVDVLAAGGQISITLTSGGNTTGSLFVPSSVTGGADLVADMVGTFTINGQVVRFTQGVDTFVRDTDFLVQGSSLRGTTVFGGATVTVVLTRS